MGKNNLSALKWIEFEDLQDYEETILFMDQIVQLISEGNHEDTVILLEHKDIITSGTSARAEDLLDASARVIKTGRGGKHTFHGLGQRVIYPIIDLKKEPWNKDLKKYLNFLHKWVINSLVQIGVICYNRADHIGIWTKHENIDKKIAAIGIRARKWVVYHGCAVNISVDLRNFSKIIPCGIADLGVTSLKELGYDINFKIFDQILKEQYYETIKQFREIS